MKILVLSNKVPFPPHDGGSLATLNMIRGLLLHGNAIHLLSLNTSKHHMPEMNNGMIDHPSFFFSSVDIDTSLRPYQLLINFAGGRVPYIYQRFDSRTFENEIRTILAKEHFDLIQMEGLPVSIYLPVIREVCHTPVALRAHNVEHQVWQRLSQSMKRGITKAYLMTMVKGIRAFETMVMNEVDYMVPISATDGQTFAGLGCSVPMHISPAGLVLEEYAYEGIFHGEPDLFYLGALDWKPNIEAVRWFVGKVWNEVRKEFPGIRFTVAGRNASVPFSRWLSSHDLYFEGEVESAVSFMRKHKIMLVPLFAGSGIRIKILEAMALGRIVICTSIAAEGIPCIPGRHLLVADTPAEFIEQIRRALTDKSLGEQIHREARTLVEENFDNFARTAALVEFYKAQGV